MKVFLQVKRLGNAFARTCLNLKLTEEKYDNIRYITEMGAVLRAQHPFNILFKNLQIGMKIHIWIAKWFLYIYN